MEIKTFLWPTYHHNGNLYADKLHIYILVRALDNLDLMHWGQDKMVSILQTTFSNAFSWMKMLELRLKFHWSLFSMVQLIISQHWFRWWPGAEQASSNYLNQWWSSLLICVTWPQWVKLPYYGYFSADIPYAFHQSLFIMASICFVKVIQCVFMFSTLKSK